MRAAIVTTTILLPLAAHAAATGVGIVVSPAASNVCPNGCAYSKPSLAVAGMPAGSAILIAPATYTDCAVIPSTKAGITLQGNGGIFRMTGQVCAGKGILVVDASNVTIRNAELFGVSNSANAAAVRYETPATGLLLDNVWLHDNDEGILSNSGTLVIQGSTLENNGFLQGGSLAHNIYVSTGATAFTLKNSISRHTKLGGHEVKSRSQSTILTCDYIATLDGTDTFEVDISDGGAVTMDRNVVEKGQNSNTATITSYAPESISSGAGAISYTGNVVINDHSGAAISFVRMYRAPGSAAIDGNTLVNATPAIGSFSGGNTSFASRSAAGLAAYPALPPVPASCPAQIGFSPAGI